MLTTHSGAYVRQPLHYATAIRRRQYVARPIPHDLARALITRYHYAGGVGCSGTVVLGLFRLNYPTQTCLGALWFQPPPLGAAKRIAGDAHRHVLCLSRAVMAPWAPRNAATFTLGAAIRYIRCLRDEHGGQRWWHLVTFADELQLRQPLLRRVPGGIYRGSNWLCLGRGRPRSVWQDRATGRLMSRYSDGHTFSAREMEERGCQRLGRFALWCFTYDLTVPAHVQTLRAHTARPALPLLVYQLPMAL